MGENFFLPQTRPFLSLDKDKTNIDKKSLILAKIKKVSGK